MSLLMIHRIRDLQSARGWLAIQYGSGYPTAYDYRLSYLLSYLRERHRRETGLFSPI